MRSLYCAKAVVFASFCSLIAACQADLDGTNGSRGNRDPGTAAPGTGTGSETGTGIGTGTNGPAPVATDPISGQPIDPMTGMPLPIPPDPMFPTIAPDRDVMRRLTRLEYDNTLRDIAGSQKSLTASFPREEQQGGFNNNGASLTFPVALAESALAAAQDGARTVLANFSQLTTCTQKTSECADVFIRDFGQMAWRRPLTASEQERLRKVYDVGNMQEGFDLGIELVATSMFISAPFWYRVEVSADPVLGKPELVRPTSWEMATRLSYFLWSSAPDKSLHGLAAQNALQTPEQVKAQALAMLESPKAKDATHSFNMQWLQLERIATIDKDPNIFPQWDSGYRPNFRKELELLANDAAWKAPRGLEYLFTTNESWVEEELGRYYGLPTALDGDTMVPVTLDGATRKGVLTRVGILAMDGFTQTSPVLRGAFIRRRMLCQEPVPPPPNLVAQQPEPSPTVTTRQQAEAHANIEPCKGCHAFIDPIGFGLEAYDAVGLFRDTQNGQPIDDSGEVIGLAPDGTRTTSDIGTFKGAVELGEKLAASQTVADCFAQNWFRVANGRAPRATELEELKQLGLLVSQTGGSYRDLLARLTETDAFLYRPKPGI